MEWVLEKVIALIFGIYPENLDYPKYREYKKQKVTKTLKEINRCFYAPTESFSGF